MFQRLNRMFVGDSDVSSSREPEFREQEDEEWVLVDFIDTCPAFSAEDDDEEEADIGAEPPPDPPAVFSCLPASLECLAEASESCFLEESWFVTPPPCFTAAGGTALKVETSPLENLLIEHPSMSVYAVHSASPEEFPGPRGDAASDVGHHIHCYVATLTAQTAFLEPPKGLRPAQWIREHSERQSLSRNSLRRQNLTRECHSRHARHSGWAVHQPCPRQFNY
ncbi:tumor protein p53-inducible nuclear protein 1 [Sorex araneus]|uniref:tumor protein p53-inducible nuclear protein 1 n=1 Tax=Sorex araneus TaxID=42254 RepID=UPI0003316795|nr:tumor protein p53-inducible nuclear protein 1 [Sorex araneus]